MGMLRVFSRSRRVRPDITRELLKANEERLQAASAEQEYDDEWRSSKEGTTEVSSQEGTTEAQPKRERSSSIFTLVSRSSSKSSMSSWRGSSNRKLNEVAIVRPGETKDELDHEQWVRMQKLRMPGIPQTEGSLQTSRLSIRSFCFFSVVPATER